MGVLVIASPLVLHHTANKQPPQVFAPWEFLCCSGLHQKEEASDSTCVWLSLLFLEACSKHLRKQNAQKDAKAEFECDIL